MLYDVGSLSYGLAECSPDTKHSQVFCIGDFLPAQSLLFR